MTGLLASVNSIDEALSALAGGADIIDLKEPAAGSLGAVSEDLQRTLSKLINGERPVSATVGDLPMDAPLMRHAIERTAATGVDLVKIGISRLDRHRACLRALASASRSGIRIVAVLFADQQPSMRWLEPLADAGCHGVMLDTADKNAGTLRRHVGLRALADFIQQARRFHLLSGLAGSLQIEDIPALLPLAPDYLGFRGALCEDGVRSGTLSPAALARVRAGFERYRTGALSRRDNPNAAPGASFYARR